MHFRLIRRRVRTRNRLAGLRGSVVPALLCCAVFSAAAQAGPPAPGEDFFPFPLIPVMETVARGAVSWRPDWPPELPPDAFSLPANAGVPAGEVRSVSLSAEPELRAVWDAEGRLREFPHFRRGFYRTEVRYDAGGNLRGLKLSGLPAAQIPSGAPREGTAAGPVPEFEFELELPGGDDAPFMVRSGDRVFWIVTAGGGDAASETWYDGEGNFFALITYRFAGTGGAGADDGTAGRIVSLEIKDRWAESCAWYGGGEMTRVESPAGVYTAVYGEKGPLYREYAPADAFSASGAASGAGPAAVLSASDAASGTGPAAAPVSGAPMDTPASAAAPFPSGTDFQWDERGFLVLLRNRDAGGAFAGEFRYEYGTDDRGNWTVRREIEMVRRSDMLVPVFRGALRRRIVYAEAGE